MNLYGRLNGFHIANLVDGAPRLFGDDPDDRLLDGRPGAPEGFLTIADRALAVKSDRTVDFEIQAIRNLQHVPLHLIHLWPRSDPGFGDFSQAAELIADGHQAAEEYLARRDLQVSRQTPWLRLLRMRRARDPKRNPNPSNPSTRSERASIKAGWRRPGVYGQPPPWMVGQ